MTTIQVFDEQLGALAAVADGDQFLVSDISTGTKLDVTWAIMKSGMGGVVDTTATVLSVTAALHKNRVVTISSAAPLAATMPAATGTGDVYTFVLTVAATATAHTISALTTDIIAGHSIVVTTTSSNAEGWATSATSDKITLNGTTQGGVVGDKIVMIDMASGVWQISHTGSATGTEATPFSAT